jgi:hypothetical protein
MYFDRYNAFKDGNIIKPVPGITLPEMSTDKHIRYKHIITRLDKLSFTYYGNQYYSWLILLANQKYGGLEFNIPNGVTIRIPYPLETALKNYNNQVTKHLNLYGNE